jgi:hypothetical protein
VVGNDPHGGNEQVWEGDRARVGVSHGTRETLMVQIGYSLQITFITEQFYLLQFHGLFQYKIYFHV